MAYGLDVEELYYADENRYDLGVLDTYNISIDTADEKDFELETPDMLIPSHGFWYIPKTEYGGIVDEYNTDSDDQIVSYYGRTWRGILASHFIDFHNAQARIFTTGTGQPQFDIDGTPANSITDVINALLVETETNDLFICDEPDTDESISWELTQCEIRDGATLYDAIIAIGESINFSYLFQYHDTDKMVHIVPILQQDYTGYMTYSNVATLGFQIEVLDTIVNHVIVVSVDEENVRRTIHIFADENGVIQPWKLVNNPIKDSQYILDKRNQKLKGVREFAQREETDGSAIENYEKVYSTPADWNISFGKYFKREETLNPENGQIEVNYSAYQAEEKVRAKYTQLPSQPPDWITNYENYYVRSYNPDYKSIDVYIVGSVPYEANWFSLTRGGAAFTPVGDQLYRIAESSGQFVADSYFEWDVEEKEYEEAEGDRYSFSNVTGDTSAGATQQITVQPVDWATHFSDYYYYFQTGTGYELRQYEGTTKEYYTLMTAQPSDWNTNFSSYYRKVYKKVSYQTVSGKKKKVISYVDCVDHKDAFYKPCAKDDDDPKGTIPSFSKRKHYRKDQSSTIPPAFNASNTYAVKTVSTAPAFGSDIFYKKTEEPYLDIPKFDAQRTYALVLDHYFDMAQLGVETINESKKTNIQKMFLDDFEVNIGDIVGGRDEITGTQIVGEITNVTAKIENGLLDVEYEVVIDLHQKGE